VSHLCDTLYCHIFAFGAFFNFRCRSVTLYHSVTQVMCVTPVIYVIHDENLIVMYHWTTNVSWEAF
jgi:hypothetical protein